MQKAGLNFHTDGLSLQTTSALGEFGVGLTNPKIFRIHYAYTMPQTSTETPSVTQPLQIAATNFVAAAAAGGIGAPVAAAVAAGTPIKVDWTYGGTHRCDVICVRSIEGSQAFWLNPAIIANFSTFKLTGTTTIAPVVSATETFDRFDWAAGVEAVYQQPSSRISALLAGSDKFLFADCLLAYSVANTLDLTFGWKAQRILADRDITLRLSAPFVGVLMRF